MGTFNINTLYYNTSSVSVINEIEFNTTISASAGEKYYFKIIGAGGGNGGNAGGPNNTAGRRGGYSGKAVLEVEFLEDNDITYALGAPGAVGATGGYGYNGSAGAAAGTTTISIGGTEIMKAIGGGGGAGGSGTPGAVGSTGGATISTDNAWNITRQVIETRTSASKIIDGLGNGERDVHGAYEQQRGWVAIHKL